jgi:deazaflavin-dependent oxidoreductase (nitroreductase family)
VTNGWDTGTLVTDAFDEQVISEFRARGGVVSGLQDLSLLLLHHVGAKSGSERVTPLAFWAVSDNAVVVLASNRGAPRHPDWYYNLVAHPTTTVEIGAQTWSVRARAAAPEERRKVTDRLVAESPSVASAMGRTSRQIPVVILELLAKVDHPPPGETRP